MTGNRTKIRIPATGDPATRAARILSDLFAPAVTVFLICVLCGVTGHPHTWVGLGWGILIGSFCAVIPTATIHVAVRREQLTDRHVTRRDQRWWVFLVCVASVLGGMATAVLLDAPRPLLWILPTMVAGLVLAGGVTLLGPKVSMHAFCFTSLIVLAAMLLSPWWLLALPTLLPVVAFARLKLKHHTHLELALGSGLAAAVMLGASAYMPAAG